jgi:hypothetical protein
VPASFRVTAAVWGEEYTSFLTDLTLPALLSPGNLPALAAALPSAFRIHTTPLDADRIRASAAYRHLASIMGVEFVPLDWERYPNKHAAMSAANIAEVRAASETTAAVVFVAPDSVWADGSLATVTRAIRAGKRAVLQAGVRLTTASALPEISNRYRPDATGAITIPPRELVRLALDHMHPSCRVLFWDAAGFTGAASNVYWRVGNIGMVMRCFHLHPLMVFPDRPVHSLASTIDDDLLPLALTRFDDAMIVQNSDDVFHVDLTVEARCSFSRGLGEPARADHLMEFVRYSTNHFHRRFFQYPIRIHTGEGSYGWNEAERASACIARQLRAHLFLDAMRRWRPGLVFGMDGHRLLERSARHGLGWGLLPEPGPFWKALCAAASLISDSGPRTLSRCRREAFARMLMATFGVIVATRALGLDLREYRRREHQERLSRGRLRRWLRETHLALATTEEECWQIREKWRFRELRPPGGRLRLFFLTFLAVRWVSLTRTHGTSPSSGAWTSGAADERT